MPYDWKGSFSRRLQQAASERGRRMANARWTADRARRDRLSAEMLPARIVARLVVIAHERHVREFTLFNFDGERQWRRQFRRAKQFAAQSL